MLAKGLPSNSVYFFLYILYNIPSVLQSLIAPVVLVFLLLSTILRICYYFLQEYISSIFSGLKLPVEMPCEIRMVHCFAQCIRGCVIEFLSLDSEYNKFLWGMNAHT